ncbi:MAG: HAMP domain-containing protein, partial [Nitrospira sp.]|nr:HAMP domain-containing protein [Nitrospira sp.]
MLNRFKNLRIKLKLVWGFGVAGLLLLIIGVMSFEGMNRLSSHTEFIYKTNLIPVTILSDLRGAMLRRSNLVVWHLLASDAATMAAREKAIVELDKTIEDLTAKYEPVIVTESEKKLFEQMTGGVPAYKKVRAKVLELSKNFSKDAAAELQKTELTEQLAVLYAALDGLIAENERQAQESYAASHSLSTTLNWTMIALNLMAILIGVLTVWFVSKLIVENLAKVLTAAEQLQNGNLTHRSQVATQDEIGQLATAFNQMAETMQGKVEQEQKNASEMKGITDALDRVQAVIEFTLDGTVLNANDNFLKTLGYTLAEIKGQHHRMFCEAAYANSGDYAAFWAKLNRGEF